MVVKNLHFVDPITSEEYDASHIEGPHAGYELPTGDYRAIAEITQFGIWGTKSYVIIQHVPTGYCYFYILEAFDDTPKSKRARSGKKSG